MRDIVERLREPSYPHLDKIMDAPAGQLLIEAADEIESLRREIELLRQGLAFEKRINQSYRDG